MHPYGVKNPPIKKLFYNPWLDTLESKLIVHTKSQISFLPIISLMY